MMAAEWVSLASCRIVGLIVTILVLFRLDRFAQLVGMNVDRRVIGNIVADDADAVDIQVPRPRRTSSARSAIICSRSLHWSCVIASDTGRPSWASALASLRVIWRLIPSSPLARFAFQAVVGQVIGKLKRLHLGLTTDICAPAHSVLRHNASSLTIRAGKLTVRRMRRLGYQLLKPPCYVQFVMLIRARRSEPQRTRRQTGR
jgi:hypothetical protein